MGCANQWYLQLAEPAKIGKDTTFLVGPPKRWRIYAPLVISCKAVKGLFLSYYKVNRHYFFGPPTHAPYHTSYPLLKCHIRVNCAGLRNPHQALSLLQLNLRPPSH